MFALVRVFDRNHFGIIEHSLIISYGITADNLSVHMKMIQSYHVANTLKTKCSLS